jgi:hypothetical protein
MSGSRRGKGGKPKKSVATAILDLGMGGSRFTDHLIISDLTFRPPNQTFNANPPRQILNQIYWVRQSIPGTITTSTTVITEINSSFSATGNLAQSSTYMAVFDQYCLHSVTYTIQNPNSNSAVGGLPQVFTAIDFDNTTNLGSTTAISAYGSCNIAILSPGEGVTRFVRPCQLGFVVPSTTNVSTRQWVDSANPSASFFGLRTIVTPTSAAIILDQTFSCIWAFRNNI